MSLPHSDHDRAVLRDMVHAACSVGELLALAERLPRKYRRAYQEARRRGLPPREALLAALTPPPAKDEIEGKDASGPLPFTVGPGGRWFAWADSKSSKP